MDPFQVASQSNPQIFHLKPQCLGTAILLFLDYILLSSHNISLLSRCLAHLIGKDLLGEVMIIS